MIWWGKEGMNQKNDSKDKKDISVKLGEGMVHFSDIRMIAFGSRGNELLCFR
jgi:hypothetical protein